MRIRTKGQTQVDTQPEDLKNTAVDNKLELLKYSVEVRSKVKNRITSDFVLCKLTEQDKIGVTEMTVNAYLAERQIINIHANATKWNYNQQTQTWTQTKPDEKTLQIIKLTQEKVFNTFMTKIEMCAILNRNVPENHMVNVLTGLRETEIQQEEEDQKQKGMVTKLMKRFKKKEEQQEDKQ